MADAVVVATLGAVFVLILVLLTHKLKIDEKIIDVCEMIGMAMVMLLMGFVTISLLVAVVWVIFT